MKKLNVIKITLDKYLKITIIIMLTTTFINAQNIDSLKIIPINPTSNDTVKIVCYTTFCYSCGYSNININIIDTTIEIYATYICDSMPVVISSVDTIAVGKLPAGTYEMMYYSIDSISQITYDADTIIFAVQQWAGLPLNKYTENGMEIYPNPAKDYAILKFSLQKPDDVKIELYDYTGRKIAIMYEGYNLSAHAFHSIDFDTKDLSNGVYFVVLKTQCIVQAIKLIIVK